MSPIILGNFNVAAGLEQVFGGEASEYRHRERGVLATRGEP